jgi:hypothetical protein
MPHLFITVPFHYPVIYRSSERSKINRVADRLDTIRIKINCESAKYAPVIYKVFDQKKFVKDAKGMYSFYTALHDHNYTKKWFYEPYRQINGKLFRKCRFTYGDTVSNLSTNTVKDFIDFTAWKVHDFYTELKGVGILDYNAVDSVDDQDTLGISFDAKISFPDKCVVVKSYDHDVKDKIKALYADNFVRIGTEFWEVSNIPCYRVIQTGDHIADFFLSHQIYKDEPNTFLPEQRDLAIKKWTDVICSGPAPMRPQQPKANIIVVK